MSETKPLTRRQQREEIVKQLYQMDIHDDWTFFETHYAYVEDTLKAIAQHKDAIDDIIVRNLKNWKLNRLSYVDRAIIRHATYELWLTDVPHEIVINEALNITRKYTDEGDDKMVGFTNRVLDNIRNDLGRQGS